VVAADYPFAFEALHSLGDRRRRKVHAAPELGERDAPVLLELREYPAIGRVEHVRNRSRSISFDPSERTRERLPSSLSQPSPAIEHALGGC
jgi:hypothetical protein